MCYHVDVNYLHVHVNVTCTSACVALSHSTFYTSFGNARRLYRVEDIIFECDSICACGVECVNHTSSRTLKENIRVFKTKKKM